jgi:hypothetical protein
MKSVKRCRRATVAIQDFRWSSLLERNKYVMTWLTADNSRDMPPAGRILGEHYIAGAESSNGAVAGFDFDLSRERNDVLTSGRGVEITQMVRRRAPKHNSMRRLKSRSLHAALEAELNLDLFKM